MQIGHNDITIQRADAKAKLTVRAAVYGIETQLTLAELDTLIAYLSREATVWRAALTPKPDHYFTLDLRRDATPAQVVAAYRKLARRHHPDKGGDAAEMTRLNAAFEVLSDPEQRKQYDTTTNQRSVS